MLRRLVIYNFQIWEKLVIDFDEYITTFVGPSDTGKSAILRALGLVCFNVPSGSSFIRHTSDGTKIHLFVDRESSSESVDTWKVSRFRSDKDNSFELDGAVFRAFGTEVPKEIEQILNLSSDINFQSQLDGPFWFDQTPGQVSKNLNQIVSLGEIDDALSAVSTKLTQARSNLKLVKDRKEKASAQVQELEWVPGLIEDLEIIKLLEEQKDLVTQKADRIGALINRHQQATDRVEKEESLVRSLERIVSLQQERNEVRNRISVIADTTQRLRQLHKKYVLQVDVDTSTIDSLRQKHTDIFDERSRLEAIVRNGKELQGELWHLNQSIQEIEERLQTISGGRCPLCGNTIESKHTH